MTVVDTAAGGRCDLAIVGGGSVTAAFLHHLVEALQAQATACARSPATPMRVRVFEPRDRLGGGAAYARDLPSNLLNVTAGAMSVAGDDKAHFQRWLAARGITHFAGRPIASGSFVSRPLFGEYLEAVCDDTVQRGHAAGVLIEHHACEVVDVVRDVENGAGSFLVVDASGDVHRAAHVLLSLGNLPATAHAGLQALPGYAHSPYPSAALGARMSRDATVGVLGTSLSAVDAIVGLAAQGHRGPIVAVSRNGRLPTVRGVLNQPQPLRPALRACVQGWLQARRDQGTRVPLDAIVARLSEELESLGGIDTDEMRGLLGPVPPATEFLAAEIEIARTRPRPWQVFGNALNEVVDALWHLLDEADRARFEHEFRGLWMSRRVNFPIENALTLQRLIASGQLRVRGGFEAVEHDASGPHAEGSFVLSLRASGGEPAERVRVQQLVNATSFSTDAAASSVPLLESLLAQGLAVSDRWGGLRADFDSGCLIGRDGAVAPRLTALGSMVAGTYFWTNAMEVNARLAMDQARRLASAWQAARGPRRQALQVAG